MAIIIGTNGANTLNGTNGIDLIFGLDGDDTLDGRAGNDLLLGGQGNDVLIGGSGNDALFGGDGNDVLFGGSQNDALQGGAGNDVLEGGSGADALSGGGGNDTLIGGLGDDSLEGGTGNDVFAYLGAADSPASDVITDFVQGEDKIDLAALLGISDLAFGGTTPTANGAWFEQSGGDTFVRADITGDALPDLSIRLIGLFNLTSSDFIGVAAPGGNQPPNAGADQTVSAAEDVADTVVLADVIGTDPDTTAPNNTLSYAITAGNGLGLFEIDGSTGEISLASGQSLDFESATQHVLTVTVSDGGAPSLTDNMQVTIDVTDVDEFDVSQPVDSALKTPNAVAENVALGTSAGLTALATDSDATNNTVSYALTGNPGGLFAIDATTGVVTTAAAIDREVVGPSVLVEVTASSSDGSTAAQTFVIAIDDVDEFDVSQPVDSALKTPNAVAENVVLGTSAGLTALATDSDATNNTVSYALTGNPGGLFAIDATTGVVTTAAAIDREVVGPSVLVEVTASSSDGSTAAQTFTIAINDVNEFAPVVEIDGAASYQIGDPAIVIDSTIAVSDQDATAEITGATVAITGGFTLGDQLQFNLQAGITGIYAVLTGELTLSGTASLAAYEAALESITFSASAVGGGARIVSFTASDGVFTSAVDTASITVTAANIDIDLSTPFAAGEGFRIFGAEAGFLSGYSVASAGDVNGDGFEDLIIGSHYAHNTVSGNTNTGVSYVIFGKASAFTDIDLATPLAAGEGFRVLGADSLDRSGTSVSSAGDVNGDGFDDLIIGARLARAEGNAKLYAGESYVIFGKASGLTDIDLASLTAAQGFRIFGVDSYDNSGFSVSSAGDVNGDGFDDLIIGAPYADAAGNLKSNAGESYVIFGQASGFTDIHLATPLAADQGFRVFGADNGNGSGRSVSSAGDVNGDGFDDLIIGAPYADRYVRAGRSYVIFGQASGFTDIDLVTLDQGFGISGADVGDRSGKSVASAGDVNGDGFDDLIIGAHYADAAGNGRYNAGESYVIFGHASGFTGIALAALTASQGFRIFGTDGGGGYSASGDRSGNSVASAGDVNGDGFDDLIVGARFADAAGNAKFNAGESYVIFGHAGGFTDIDLATLTAAQGFRIFGADSGDYSGVAVSSAGDVDGDGFDDLIIGAFRAAAAGNAKGGAGESTVIFGGAFGAVAVDDTLTGTAAADNLNGGLGNDLLIGGGGADVLIGGAGNDTIEVADTTFFKVDGGGGDDTLVLLVSGAIDFGDLDGNAATSERGKISATETIDVTNGQANALTLAVADVLDLDVTNANVLGTTNDNVLAIKGDVGDTLALIDPGADTWAASGGTFSHGGVTYQLYTAGPTDALKVAVDIEIAVATS